MGILLSDGRHFSIFNTAFATCIGHILKGKTVDCVVGLLICCAEWFKLSAQILPVSLTSNNCKIDCQLFHRIVATIILPNFTSVVYYFVKYLFMLYQENNYLDMACFFLSTTKRSDTNLEQIIEKSLFFCNWPSCEGLPDSERYEIKVWLLHFCHKELALGVNLEKITGKTVLKIPLQPKQKMNLVIIYSIYWEAHSNAMQNRWCRIMSKIGMEYIWWPFRRLERIWKRHHRKR